MADKAKPRRKNKEAGTKPVGRPPEFSQEIADAICERIATGESLRSISCDPGMPGQSTVFRWLAKDENADFREQYARARETQADVLFDEILTIADTPVIGVKTVTKATGVEKTEGDMIEHRRLQVDARKWMLGKMQPKKYGDKVVNEHSGEVSFTRIERVIVDPTGKDDDTAKDSNT